MFLWLAARLRYQPLSIATPGISRADKADLALLRET